MNNDGRSASALSSTELEQLVSHILGLRKDFIQDLLREAKVSPTGRKADLRDRLRTAIDTGKLPINQVIAFLDRHALGEKQHVFLYRADARLDEWRDTAAVRRRLSRRSGIDDLLDASLPLGMPEALALSSVRLANVVEISAVQARTYYERAEEHDRREPTDEGLYMELRAYIQRVTRTTVRLRWNVARRRASLHITQSTQRSVARDYYDHVESAFADLLDPWLDFTAFQRLNLRRVIHRLHDLERRPDPLTRSRRGNWELPGGSELQASSPSVSESVFTEREMVRAIGAVATPASGQLGNMFWRVDHSGASGVLTEDLHTTIVASDSRIHFMRPSSEAAIDYVLDQVRRLS